MQSSGPPCMLPAQSPAPFEWLWLQSSSGDKGNRLGTLNTLACKQQWEDSASRDSGQRQRPSCPKASWDLDTVCEPRGSTGQPLSTRVWRQRPWAQIMAPQLVSCGVLYRSANHLVFLCLSVPICQMEKMQVFSPHGALMRSKKTNTFLGRVQKELLQDAPKHIAKRNEANIQIGTL